MVPVSSSSYFFFGLKHLSSTIADVEYILIIFLKPSLRKTTSFAQFDQF